MRIITDRVPARGPQKRQKQETHKSRHQDESEAEASETDEEESPRRKSQRLEMKRGSGELFNQTQANASPSKRT